jgi:serine/threonine-protein kinase
MSPERHADSLALAQQVDALCDHFEEALRAGNAGNWWDWLPPAGPARGRALAELPRLDLEHRLRAGEPVRVEAYLARCPELKQDAEAVLALITHEYEVRRLREPQLTLADYDERFPNLTRHLRQFDLPGTQGLAPPAPTEGVPGLGGPWGVVSHTEAEGITSRLPHRLLSEQGLPSPGGVGLDLRAYQLLERLGSGGMGEVYLSRDPGLDRLLALKVLRAEWQGNPDMERRFQAEARITGSLQHPAIVPVHDLGRLPDGRLFFTMKVVRGRTFADMLAEPGANVAGQQGVRLGVFAQVCQAVAYAHSKGVIHRDLKPENVMVGRFGEVQVMDWGLAKLLPRASETAVHPAGAGEVVGSQPGEVGQTYGAVGTLAYMAPEQANGEWERADERLDVFGLGGILCAILTGQPPYVGDSVAEVQHKAQSGDLREAIARLEGCGAEPELVRLARACLSAEVEGRPRHAGQVTQSVESHQAALEQRLRHAELGQARAEARAEGERKRRRLTLALATAVFLLVAGVGSGAWLLQQQRAEAQARQREAGRQAMLALQGGRPLLEEGWQANDVAKVEQARAEAERAVDIAARGEAEPAVRQQADAFRRETQERLGRARSNGALMAALADISVPRETRRYAPDESGLVAAVAEPSVEEQYAAAFRHWGVDVDRTPDAELVACFQREPEPVRQEVIAGLDAWMLERRKQKALEERWRRLLGLAGRLDHSAVRRHLRALLSGGLPPHPTTVAGVAGALAGPGLPWAALAGLACDSHAHMPELRGPEKLANEPVLTVVLLARTYWAFGDRAGAEQVLRQAVAARPQQVVLLNDMGRMLEGSGRLGEATEYYRAAHMVRPQLGVALARGLVKTGRGAEGEGVLHDLVGRQPNNPDMHFFLGHALHEQKKLSEAVGSYRQAVALDPRHAPAHNNLGAVWYGEGKVGEGVACFQKAIFLDPKCAVAHCNLGVALKGKGEVEGAIDCYQKAILHDPKCAVAHCNLGNALKVKGDLGGAIECYRKAIDINPKLAPAHDNLGVALKGKGDVEGAIESHLKAIAADPKNASAYYNLGNALRGKGEVEGAIDCFHKAVALQPKFARAHSNLGLALYGKGEVEGAIDCYQKAILHDPKCAEAHCNLGNALESKGQEEGAIECYQKAIAADPEYANAHGALGRALLQQGRFAESCVATRRCLELLPAGRPLRQYVSRLLERCQRLLESDSRLIAVLQGEARPKDAGEHLDLAWLALRPSKGQYAAAARLYAEAFADKGVRADLLARHRYHAARASALAAAGKGQGGAELTDKERARLRGLALDWLRADLTAWGKLVGGPAEQRLRVRQRLTYWRADPNLTGVRDKDALAELPADEHANWQALWGEVDSMLQRVGEKK